MDCVQSFKQIVQTQPRAGKGTLKKSHQFVASLFLQDTGVDIKKYKSKFLIKLLFSAKLLEILPQSIEFRYRYH